MNRMWALNRIVTTSPKDFLRYLLGLDTGFALSRCSGLRGGIREDEALPCHPLRFTSHKFPVMG